MTAYEQYASTAWPTSLDSFEGVPEQLDVFAPRKPPEERNAAQQWAHDVLGWVGVVAPGVLMALGLAYLGHLLSDLVGRLMGYQKSPVSPIMLAVMLGLVIRNTV